MTGLINSYQPELILGPRGSAEKLLNAEGEVTTLGPAQSGASGVEWIARTRDPSFAPIDPTLQLLLSTSGTTGSQKYVRLSRDAVTANARQIAEALAIDERSVGIAHLPLHYSYGLSVVTSHLTSGGRLCLVNDSITSPSFWSKIANVGGSHFPGVPFHYVALARLGAALVPESVKTFHASGRRARSSRSNQDSRMGGAARWPVFRHVRTDRSFSAHGDAAARRPYSQSRFSGCRACWGPVLDSR